MEEKEKLLRYIQELAVRIQSLKARVNKLKEDGFLKTVSGDIVSIENAVPNRPLVQLLASIEPVQSGSGEPSPTNIRPISGHTEVNVRVYNEYEDVSYNVPLDQTVYGGVLDVTSGVLTVNRAMVDMGTLNWVLDARYANKQFYALLSINWSRSANILPICSQYKGILIYWEKNINNTIGITNDQYVICVDNRYETATAFKTAVAGQQLVYPIATPQTYQLTPTEVRTLLGDNNILADTGSVEVTYRATA